MQFKQRSERLLLDELTHRVNNHLAAAIGLTSVAVARVNSAQIAESLVHLKCQLEGFARVQQLLQVPHFRTRIDGFAYLRHLCPALERAHLHGRDVDLVLVERALSIDSEHCWRFGVILAELVTNAAKHAFRDRPGQIRVEAIRERSIIRCEVEDNGVGYTSARPAGCGLRIIDALTNELEGRFEQRLSPEGCVSTVWFPDETA